MFVIIFNYSILKLFSTFTVTAKIHPKPPSAIDSDIPESLSYYQPFMLACTAEIKNLITWHEPPLLNLQKTTRAAKSTFQMILRPLPVIF